MFFPLIPLTSDAPRRCRPWGSGLLVVAHIGLFAYEEWPALFGGAAKFHDQLVLTLGAANPFIWLSSGFLHGTWVRLILDVLFLWTFGSLVEVRLGTIKFLVLYVALAIGGPGLWNLAVDQWPQFVDPFWRDAAASGSSLVVYALLTIAFVWGPSVNVTCFAWIWIKAFIYELPLGVLALIYILADLGLTMLTTGIWLGAVAHASGALLGFIVAVLLLAIRVVDGQGWDLFSVMRGKQQDVDLDEMRKYRSRTLPDGRQVAVVVGQETAPPIEGPESPPEEPPDPATIERRREAALTHLRAHLANNDARAASRLIEQVSKVTSDWIPQAELAALIQLLLAQQLNQPAATLLDEAVRRFPTDGTMRLQQAEIVLHHLDRPQRAQELLQAALPLLTDAERAAAEKLLAEAQRRVDEGEIELEG